MKILLFGASGQLGSDIRKRIRTDELHGFSLPELDIANSEQVMQAVEHVRPDVIINAAAFTDVDGAEKNQEAAFLANEKGAEHVACAAVKNGSYLMHISTDYVFNGENSRPWRESDPVAPLGVYGASKLAGEKAVLGLLPSAAVIRTSWLHGAGGKNFLQTMLRLFNEKEEVRVVDDQIGNPTWSGWLASVLLELSEIRPAGVLHASCKGEVSWFGFAKYIWELAHDYLPEANLKRLLPQPSSELNRPAPRPRYSAMDCSRLEAVTGKPAMSWKEGVRSHLLELEILR